MCLRMGLKILQINLQHKKLATANLVKKQKTNDYDMILIQEPWVVKGRVAGLTDIGGKLLYDTSCSATEPPRTCLIIKQNINFLLLQEHCSTDLVAVEMKLTSRELTVESAYFPFDSGKPAPTIEVECLDEETLNSSGQLLLGCDANAHHTAWGSSNCNSRGESLLEFIFTNKLLTLNEGNRPTFITSNRREVLDITLSTVHIAGLIRNWRVLEEPSLADHQYISFELNEKLNETTKTFRDPYKTNWERFREDLKAGIQLLPTGIPRTKEDLDKLGNSIEQVIIKSSEKHCPLKTQMS